MPRMAAIAAVSRTALPSISSMLIYNTQYMLDVGCVPNKNESSHDGGLPIWSGALVDDFMHPLLHLWSAAAPFVDLFIGLVLLKKPALIHQRALAFAFLCWGASGFGWRFLVESHAMGVEPWATFGNLLGLMGGMLALVGAVRLQAGSSSAGERAGSVFGKGVSMVTSIINRYFSTDELLSRFARVPTVHEDIEQFKLRWHEALRSIVQREPERTALISAQKYGRSLLLERYCSMGTFGDLSCGQLRSVEITIAGPGDPAAWMTVTVRCSVDQVTVGTVDIRNDHALAARDLTSLSEYMRIVRFLDSGKFKKSFADQLTRLGKGLLTLLLVPVHLAIFAMGLMVGVARGIVNRGRIHTRFVAAQRPSVLPFEETGAPVGYWYVLIEDQADKAAELLAAVRNRLGQRSESGTKVYEQEIVQWGGYSLKEIRQQTVAELRRCKIYLAVYRYGKDLYVRWDSHLNRRTWNLQKFPYLSSVGYKFKRSRFSWAIPMFEDVPSTYEFAPAVSATTDYDWADLDALEGLVHGIMTLEVKRLKERYEIEKEIDYEIKKGPAAMSAPSSERATEEGKSGPRAWSRTFARRK